MSTENESAVHDVETRVSILSDTSRAVCSCGWMGEERDSILDASRDCHDHREAVRETP